MNPDRIALTASRLSTRRTCLRQDWFRYELQWRPARSATQLRFGTAYHLGLETNAKTANQAEAVAVAAADYETCPEWSDPFDWAIERATLRGLLAGHFWRYAAADPVDHLAAELKFEMPLINPETGRPSTAVYLAGKIDGIVKLHDGRLAVQEIKTTSADVSDSSDYWAWLRYDGQISMYMLGARHLGYDVQTVLYDATRKPGIRPVQVPVLDEAGLKIVMDEQGQRVLRSNILKSGEPGKGHGEPIQSASKDKGWTLVTRTESPAEYEERLLSDIGERPDYYYGRREIPRLDDDLRTFQAELWQQSKSLLESRRAGWWFRNVSPNTCKFCDYAGLCLSSSYEPGAVAADTPPPGFAVVAEQNPELSDSEQE